MILVSYGVMQHCWCFEPSERPTFAELCTDLKRIRTDSRVRDVNSYLEPSESENANPDYDDLYSILKRDLLDLLKPQVRKEVDKCLVDPSRMQLSELILGKGFFGEVYKGTYTSKRTNTPITCAIKTMKSERVF